MKKKFLFLLAVLIGTEVTQAGESVFTPDSITTPVTHKEINTYSCAGYLRDFSGDGWFVYGELSFKVVKNNHMIGAFFGSSYADCLFSDYQYYGNEMVMGVNYTRWGSLSKNTTYALSISPCFKHFSDQGFLIESTEKVFQKDWGNQITIWFNISDKLNRPLRNLKVFTIFQTTFWSKREGLIDGEYVTDNTNYKAVNRTFFKGQLETVIKKISVKQIGKIEPKLVTGFLRDWSAKKNYYEFGLGLGLSFNKGARYYEVVNLQYRARFGDDFQGFKNSRRLDLFEVGIDPKELYKFIFL